MIVPEALGLGAAAEAARRCCIGLRRRSWLKRFRRPISSAGSMPSRAMRSRIAGHSSSMKRPRSPSRSRARAPGATNRPTPRLDNDQPFVLETLISLGDGQGVRLLLGGKRADRRQADRRREIGRRGSHRRSSRGGERKRAFRGACEASCCSNTAARIDGQSYRWRPFLYNLRRIRPRPFIKIATGRADEDEAGNTLSRAAEGRVDHRRIGAPAGDPATDIAHAHGRR